MLFIFQTLLPTRHTRPSGTHVLMGDWSPAPAAPLSSAVEGVGAPRKPSAHAADGLAHYIDSRMPDTRFRID